PGGHGPVPDRAFGVETDAVRDAVAEVGPHAPVGQAAVRGDVEGGEPLGVGLGDDQRSVVGCDEHAVGEREVVCDLASGAVGGDQGDDAGGERLAGHQVEAAAVHVRV